MHNTVHCASAEHIRSDGIKSHQINLPEDSKRVISIAPRHDTAGTHPFIVPRRALYLSPAWDTRIIKQSCNFTGLFFCIMKPGSGAMNEMLRAALCGKYGMPESEAMEVIAAAKRNGKLLELYELALMKFEMEMKRHV